VRVSHEACYFGIPEKEEKKKEKKDAGKEKKERCEPGRAGRIKKAVRRKKGDNQGKDGKGKPMGGGGGGGVLAIRN